MRVGAWYEHKSRDCAKANPDESFRCKKKDKYCKVGTKIRRDEISESDPVKLERNNSTDVEDDSKVKANFGV